MKHIYTTIWHQFNWEHHHIHVTCDQATWISELYLSDHLHVPAALSPEERRADNPPPLSLSLKELQNLVTQSTEVKHGRSVNGKRPKQANGWSGSPWTIEVMKQFSKLRYRRSNFNHWRSLQLNVPSKPHKTPFLCNRAGIMKLGPSTAVLYSHIPVILRFNAIGSENIKKPSCSECMVE